MQTRAVVLGALNELSEGIKEISSGVSLHVKITSLVQRLQELKELKANADSSMFHRLHLPKDVDEQLADCDASLKKNRLLESRYRILKPILLAMHNNILKLIAEYQSSNRFFSANKLHAVEDSIGDMNQYLSNISDVKIQLDDDGVRLSTAINELLIQLTEAEMIDNIDAPFAASEAEVQSWEIRPPRQQGDSDIKSMSVFQAHAEEGDDVDSFYDSLLIDEEQKSAPPLINNRVLALSVQSASSSSAISSLLSALSDFTAEYLGPILPAPVLMSKPEISEQEKQAALQLTKKAFNKLKQELINIKSELSAEIKALKKDDLEIAHDIKLLTEEMNSFEMILELQSEKAAAKKADLEGAIKFNREKMVENGMTLSNYYSEQKCVELCRIFLTDMTYRLYVLPSDVTVDSDAITKGVDEINQALQQLVLANLACDKRHETDNIFKLFAILLSTHFPKCVPVKPVNLTPDADLIHNEEDQRHHANALLVKIKVFREDLKESIEIHDDAPSVLQSDEVNLLYQLNKMNHYFHLYHDVKARELTELALTTLEAEVEVQDQDYYAGLYQWISQMGELVSKVLAQKALERWSRFNITIRPADGKFPMLPLDNLKDTVAKPLVSRVFKANPQAASGLSVSSPPLSYGSSSSLSRNNNQ
jgi:uncharacterized protein YktB (UPF0637 family)